MTNTTQQKLFSFLEQEFGAIALDSDMIEIERIIMDEYQKPLITAKELIDKFGWWIAEGPFREVWILEKPDNPVQQFILYAGCDLNSIKFRGTPDTGLERIYE